MEHEAPWRVSHDIQFLRTKSKFMRKVSKESAQYRLSQSGMGLASIRSCAQCIHWYQHIGDKLGICYLVKGSIKPEALCKLWEGGMFR